MNTLTPSQALIARDRRRFRVICCGRRFGKTTLAIEEIKAVAAMGGKRVAYIANTYQQARDIAWEQLKKELIKAGCNINESRLELKFKGINGQESLIILRGWESIETLRGQAFDFIVIDEVASIRNFVSMWQEVIRPTLTDTMGEVMFISTPKGFNHFYDLFNLESKDADYKSFHFTSYDNPFLPEEELNKAKFELTEDRFAQEYMADFRKTEGLVYKEFERDKHIYTDLGEKMITFNTKDVSVGVDFGFTNPCAILKVEQDTDGRFFVSQEWYKTQKTTPEIIEIARSFGGNYYYPDPAEPDRIEEMRRSGLNVREVSKDVEAGINAVRELLKSGRLYIHSSCVNLISEFETYSYPEKKPNQNEPEAPIKEDDHALDALRYVLYMKAKRANGQAYVHYSESAQPLPRQSVERSQSEISSAPKIAHVYTPYQSHRG